MKLYEWNSVARKFTRRPAGGDLPEGDRVLVASLEITKGDQVIGGPGNRERWICVLKGAWILNIDGSNLIVRRNEGVVIPPGTEHRIEALRDSFALQVVCDPEVQ